MKTTIPYCIVAPGWTHKSSGVRALHLLCHELNKAGQKAFMIPDNANGWGANPYLDTPLVSPTVQNFYAAIGVDPIVIYPDVIRGNPCNAKRVVRYLLAPAGKYGGDCIFSIGDKVWSYTQAIADDFNSDKVMLLPTFDTDIFYEPVPTKIRKDICFYAHKYDRIHGQKLLPITDNAVRCEGTSEQIAEILRSSEVCYVYEPSEITVLAGLCGCPVRLVRTEYFNKVPDAWEFSYMAVKWTDEEACFPSSPIISDHYLNAVHELNVCFRGQLQRFIGDTQTW